MITTPTESDPFFQLLTEALRAGPGSAQWGEAVAKLRDGGVEGADEYKLILRAREDIELGRDYKKVTAGAGFTRKVLDAVEREGTRRSGIPTATIVAILAALVILGVIVTVIVIMSRGGDAKDPQQAAIERLERSTSPISMASVAFNGQLRWPVDGFRVVDGVALDVTKELRLGAAPTTAISTTQASKFASGGLITSMSLNPIIPAAIEAEVILPQPGAGQPLTQLFVSDSPDLKPDAAAPAREIIWTYRDGRASVDVEGRGQESVNLGTPGETIKVSIRFDRETAIVEAGGRRLYAGPHGLGDKPRYAGLRFLQAAGDTGESVRVRSLSVSQSAPTRMQE